MSSAMLCQCVHILLGYCAWNAKVVFLCSGRRSQLKERAEFQIILEYIALRIFFILIQCCLTLAFPGEGKWGKTTSESPVETFMSVRVCDQCCSLLDGL